MKAARPDRGPAFLRAVAACAPRGAWLCADNIDLKRGRGKVFNLSTYLAGYTPNETAELARLYLGKKRIAIAASPSSSAATTSLLVRRPERGQEPKGPGNKARWLAFGPTPPATDTTGMPCGVQTFLDTTSQTARLSQPAGASRFHLVRRDGHRNSGGGGGGGGGAFVTDDDADGDYEEPTSRRNLRPRSPAANTVAGSVAASAAAAAAAEPGEKVPGALNWRPKSSFDKVEQYLVYQASCVGDKPVGTRSIVGMSTFLGLAHLRNLQRKMRNGTMGFEEFKELDDDGLAALAAKETPSPSTMGKFPIRFYEIDVDEVMARFAASPGVYISIDHGHSTNKNICLVRLLGYDPDAKVAISQTIGSCDVMHDGESCATAVLSVLNHWQLLDKMRGTVTDSASAMLTTFANALAAGLGRPIVSFGCLSHIWNLTLANPYKVFGPAELRKPSFLMFLRTVRHAQVKYIDMERKIAHEAGMDTAFLRTVCPDAIMTRWHTVSAAGAHVERFFAPYAELCEVCANAGGTSDGFREIHGRLFMWMTRNPVLRVHFKFMRAFCTSVWNVGYYIVIGRDRASTSAGQHAYRTPLFLLLALSDARSLVKGGWSSRRWREAGFQGTVDAVKNLSTVVDRKTGMSPQQRVRGEFDAFMDRFLATLERHAEAFLHRYVYLALGDVKRVAVPFGHVLCEIEQTRRNAGGPSVDWAPYADDEVVLAGRSLRLVVVLQLLSHRLLRDPSVMDDWRHWFWDARFRVDLGRRREDAGRDEEPPRVDTFLTEYCETPPQSATGIERDMCKGQKVVKAKYGKADDALQNALTLRSTLSTTNRFDYSRATAADPKAANQFSSRKRRRAPSPAAEPAAEPAAAAAVSPAKQPRRRYPWSSRAMFHLAKHALARAEAVVSARAKKAVKAIAEIVAAREKKLREKAQAAVASARGLKEKKQIGRRMAIAEKSDDAFGNAPPKLSSLAGGRWKLGQIRKEEKRKELHARKVDTSKMRLDSELRAALEPFLDEDGLLERKVPVGGGGAGAAAAADVDADADAMATLLADLSADAMDGDQDGNQDGDHADADLYADEAGVAAAFEDADAAKEDNDGGAGIADDAAAGDAGDGGGGGAAEEQPAKKARHVKGKAAKKKAAKKKKAPRKAPAKKELKLGRLGRVVRLPGKYAL